MILFQKNKFYPLDPRADEVHTIDIAHALSLTCRFNGHCSHFHSVAQHSLNCAEEAKILSYPLRIQFACLLHDGEEAYVSDITRPVKKHLPEYKVIANRIQSVIWEKYGLSDLTREEHEIIKQIDDALLAYEGSVLIGKDFYKSPHSISKNYDLTFRNMAEVRDEFIERVNVLARLI